MRETGEVDESTCTVFDLLRNRGWALFDLQRLQITKEESVAIQQWETVFASAFNLNKEDKEAAGCYRVEQGVSVGYRVDNEREFFESRLVSNGLCEPNLPIEEYATTVRSLYSIFSKIANCCIEEIASNIGLDPQSFLDLTDIDSAGILPVTVAKVGSDADGGSVPTLSSSLLRICKYKSDENEEVQNCAQNPGNAVSVSPDNATDNTHDKGDKKTPKSVWFGAHTDSSFLTISLCSSTPGLDIVDQTTNTWVCPEQLQQQQQQEHRTLSSQPARFAIVFVGEFLQVLTKNRFRAAVHRVRNFSAELCPVSSAHEDEAEGELNELKNTPSTRISCPFIIRGRNNAIIDLHNTARYSHPGGAGALSTDKVPDLDETSMKLMHKLLDLKRQKCFRENGSAEGASWVLSAFPVPPLPEE